MTLQRQMSLEHGPKINPPPPPCKKNLRPRPPESRLRPRPRRAVYPPECLRNKQAGTVMLMLYINEFGSVDRVEVVRSSGFPALDRAAAAAEKRSRFRPAVAGGRPVKSKARVPYTFQVK